VTNSSGDDTAARLLPAGRAGSVHITPPVATAVEFALGSGRIVLLSDASDHWFVVPMVADADGDRRARAGDGLAQALVAGLADPGRWPADLDVAVQRVVPASGERAMGVDQTHESVIVGDEVVVKWTVTAEPGEQPAPARLRRLHAAGFCAIPTPIATVTWRPPAASPVLVASVDEFIPDASDGWTWYVDVVRSSVRGDADLASAIEPAREIGRLTARMHHAFATTGELVLADADDTAGWARAAHAVLDEALGVVDGDEGDRLAARLAVINGDLEAIATAAPTPVIDVHGDFHVGQVLRTPDVANGWRYVFTDFDGNPVLALAERRQPQPAARDVAGMLASLDHVGRVVVKRTEGIDADAVAEWIGTAEAAFLDSYQHELHTLGRAELFDVRLLRGFRAEQECREFVYAARHLPHWRYVPDAALAAMYPEEVL
jgi:maltokinase